MSELLMRLASIPCSVGRAALSDGPYVRPPAGPRYSCLNLSVGVCEGQRRGQLAVRLDLREEPARLVLDGFDGVSACQPPGGRLVCVDERDEGGGKLAGVAGLLAVHAVPGDLVRGGLLGVVVD